MSNLINCLILAVILCSCTTAGNSDLKTSNTQTDSLTNELHKVYKKGQFNGFAVAIVNEDGTLYKNGFGFANVENQKKYTENTIQNIGSVSKTLVGIALLKAQELGKLRLDEPINKYLPFKVVNPFHPEVQITIRNLATHTSTITDNEYYLKRNYILKADQNSSNVQLKLDDEQIINPSDSIIPLKDYLQNVLAVDGKWHKKEDFLNRKPGELFEYSNVATGLAAYIVENATGKRFDEFTQQYILKPLEMKSSGWKFEDIEFSKYSTLYQTPTKALPYYSLITYPDGNFITSSSDLAKYLTELIKGFSGNGTILSRESYKAYFKPQLDAKNYLERNEKNPYSDEFNIGIFVGISYTGNIGHTGGDPGIATMMFFDPKNKIGKLLMVNTNINDKKGSEEFYEIWKTLEKYQGKLSGSKAVIK